MGGIKLNSSFGDNLSFRETGLYTINKKNSVKIIAGVSYLPTNTAQYFNADEFTGKGFELEINYRKKDWGNIYINYSYIVG